jgi:phage terminase small subunit
MAGNHRSGRKPKPDALRVLQGGRARGLAKPKTLQGRPEPLKTVAADEVALGHWHRYADILERLDLLGQEHADLLATLAHVTAQEERALEDYAAAGYKLFVAEKVGEHTRYVETPFVARIEKLGAQKVKLLGEFGLTPTMATKVARQHAGQERSKWSEFGAGGKGRATG